MKDTYPEKNHWIQQKTALEKEILSDLVIENSD